MLFPRNVWSKHQSFRNVSNVLRFDLFPQDMTYKNDSIVNSGQVSMILFFLNSFCSFEHPVRDTLAEF